MIKDIKSKLGGIFRSDKKTRIIVLIGIAGIVLIAFSGKSSDKTEPNQPSIKSSDILDNAQTTSFKDTTTEELEDILEKIEGVGECRVFLSVDGTSEYVFAENIERSQDYSSNGSSENYESQIVMIDDSGKSNALVKKIIRPKINGVVVVCKGGGDATVKERVIKAVSTALDLSYGKICVEGKI